MKKVIRVVLPLIIIAICVLMARWMIANKKKPTRHNSARPPTVVNAMRVQPQDYQILLRSSGTVQPRTQSTLIPEIAGKIISISANFRAGGFFEAGEELIALEDRVYKAAITVAESELVSARLALEQEKIRVKNYQNELVQVDQRAVRCNEKV